MRVNACVEHKRYEGLDFTPVEPQEEGHVLAEALRPDFPYGEVRLDCYFCSWAPPPVVDDVGPDLSYLPTSPAVVNVEQALGSVGNPTELSGAGIGTNPGDYYVNVPPKVVKRNRIVKEKNVAKDKAETPKKRERKRGTPVGKRMFGPIAIACYLVDDTRENYRKMTPEQFAGLKDFLSNFPLETPKGA